MLTQQYEYFYIICKLWQEFNGLIPSKSFLRRINKTVIWSVQNVLDVAPWLHHSFIGGSWIKLTDDRIWRFGRLADKSQVPSTWTCCQTWHDPPHNFPECPDIFVVWYSHKHTVWTSQPWDLRFSWPLGGRYQAQSNPITSGSWCGPPFQISALWLVPYTHSHTHTHPHPHPHAHPHAHTCTCTVCNSLAKFRPFSGLFIAELFTMSITSLTIIVHIWTNLTGHVFTSGIHSATEGSPG